jgi:hypothetical protein
MTIDILRDVMQVCLSGHVITDVLASHPEQGSSHCDRCGSPTLSRCPTCGEEIPGAAPLAGLMPIGRRPAPQHCPRCGAAFPWAVEEGPAPAPNTLSEVQALLRRLPRAAHQLRERHAGRPTLRVDDVHDLEDLLRAALHLQFDNVRRETRTPTYASDVRTDFVIVPNQIAVMAKLLTANAEPQIASEIREDTLYYQRLPEFTALAVLIYDPEQFLRDRQSFEAALASNGIPAVRCVVS